MKFMVETTQFVTVEREIEAEGPEEASVKAQALMVEENGYVLHSDRPGHSSGFRVKVQTIAGGEDQKMMVIGVDAASGPDHTARQELKLAG